LPELERLGEEAKDNHKDYKVSLKENNTLREKTDGEISKLNERIKKLDEKLPTKSELPQPNPAIAQSIQTSNSEEKPALSNKELQDVADKLHKLLVDKPIPGNAVKPSSELRKLSLYWFPANFQGVYEKQVQLLHQFHQDAINGGIQLTVQKAGTAGFDPISDLTKLTGVFEKNTISGDVRSYFEIIAKVCKEKPTDSLVLLASSEHQPDTRVNFACKVTCLLVNTGADKEENLGEWTRLLRNNPETIKLAFFSTDGAMTYASSPVFWAPPITVLTKLGVSPK